MQTAGSRGVYTGLVGKKRSIWPAQVHVCGKPCLDLESVLFRVVETNSGDGVWHCGYSCWLKAGPEPKKYSIVEYFPSVSQALCLNPRLPLLPKYVRFTIIINLKYIYTEVDYTNTK